MKKKTVIILLIIALIIIAAAIYVFNGIHKYMMAADGITYDQMTDEEKAKYSSMALIPELKDHCVRYNVRFLETPRNGKYKRVTIECNSTGSLPESYQEPVIAALDSDHYISTTDLDHKSVKVYTVETGLPLSDVDDLPSEYRDLADRVSKTYYQVMVYPDGSQRFMFWFEYQ